MHKAWIVGLLMSLTSAAGAAPLAEADVPAPLKPWIGWVLHDQDTRRCPIPLNDTNQRLCVWPAQIALMLTASGGKFTMTAELLAPGWLALPGDSDVWPQDVSRDGQSAPAVMHEGRPMLFLPAGTHTIAGAFQWPQMPESLFVPPDAGLVTLTVDGAPRNAGRDRRNHVWLARAATAEAAAGNHLEVKVFRLIDDDIPPRLTTHLDLEVTGEVRDEVLGPVLPAGFAALTLSGNLAARLDDQNRLHVQVRPGVWSIDVTGRATAPLAKLGATALPAPWPTEEVWSFSPHNELRVVEVGGAPAIDPRQTQMPEYWHSFPAYMITPNTALTFVEKQRGSPEADPDQLVLRRQLWLDFDGRGYTLQDSLQGRLSRSWRLEAATPIALGRVEVDGEPQLITKHKDGVGVEVRHGQLNLVADSRIEDAPRKLPAAGWNTDLQSVSTQLNLPPGWRLIAAPGADQAWTWVARWTLLDLFIVLIAAVAALRLFGPAWAALTLVTLALIWHEPGAPRGSWLGLIAMTALLRVLPASYREGRLHAWLKRARWLAAFALVLIAVPFAIHQARVALYPQLDAPWNATPLLSVMTDHQLQADIENAPPPAAPMPMEEAESRDEDSLRARNGGIRGAMAKKSEMKVQAMADMAASSSAAQVAQQSIKRMDPNVLTQTGPGLPNWQWQQIDLSWNGPVTPDQHVRLWLLSPGLTRLLQALSIVLIGMLIARWLEFQMPRMPTRATTAIVPLFLALGLATATRDARAQENPPGQPPQAILDQLRERLLAPPDCAPICAQQPRLQISANPAGALTLRATLEAAAGTAVPLPVPAITAGAQGTQWQPASVVIDGHAASLRRGADGLLWLNLAAGKHEVLISGSLQGVGQLQIPLPLKPHLVTSTVDGWLLSGVNERGQPADALQLLRKSSGTEAAAPTTDGETAQALPPLLIVTRTLHLGMDWDVETNVQRVGVVHTPIIARVPLLPGERLTGERIRMRDGEVELSFAPGQSTAGWASRLPLSEQLTLQASDATDRFEIWRFDVSPLWHAEFAGIAPVFHTANDYRLPSFQPWPGEKVQVAISRPSGVGGQTVTLDNATLQIRPGQRATDEIIELDLRASQGGQYRLPLPPATTAQALMIDGATQPLRSEGGQLVLPVHPGAQHFQITLRADQGVTTLLHTPELQTGRGVNARINLEMPQDRWILLVGGPRLGPAVLFWGVLVVLLGLAYALGQVTLTPLRARQWVLLMIGLSQLPVLSAAVVVIWLMALGLRGRRPIDGPTWKFNLTQLALVALTLIALGLLFRAVAQGLLGAPDMQIEGNGSVDHTLAWFQDRYDAALPQAWVVSVPMWSYRLLMLAWALWLANALLRWLRWGWEQFANGGLWRKSPKLVKGTSPAPPAS